MKNNFLFLLFFALTLFMACSSATDQQTPKETSASPLAFIGTYTQKEGHVDGKGTGVSIYQTGPTATDWKHLHSFSDIINPSYLCLSPKHPIIYAVSEQGPDVPAPKSVIKVLQYDPVTFEIKELQQVSALGHAPCYISTDRTGKYVVVANYVSGNVIAYAINTDGSLQEGVATQHLGKGPHPRQEAPHAHYIQQHPSQANYYAVDLGLDLVIEYQMSAEGLQAKDSITVTSGSGPRHLVWHPNGQTMYILNELSGTIEVWNWNKNSSEQQQVIALGKDERDTGAADIHITQDGRFVYASLRGDFDEIIVLEANPISQDLRIVQRVSAGGSAPRNFALSPKEDYVAVASQNSDRIALFSRDAQTGQLNSSPEIVQVNTPVCIAFQEE